MSTQTLEIKYVREHDTGEKFYPVTHKDAVTGLNTALSGKQTKLVSGVNLKTINGVSLLGEGDITIAGGSGGEGGIVMETDPTVPSWAKLLTKPTYTAQEVGALPDTTSIPSKTSDLTNDSGFITASDISGKADSDDIPTNTSDLNNDSGFITSTDIEGKQDTIDDLETIRNGAGLGATAAQPEDVKSIYDTPIETKTYTNLYYGANGSSNGYFDPICVKPKDTTKTIGYYYIKVLAETTCPLKYPNYVNRSIIELWFNRTGSINCSCVWNSRVGSYLHYYVHATYPTTNANWDSIGTHFGVSVTSGNNYNNSAYYRTTKYSILDISDDLTYSFESENDLKQYVLMPWYTAIASSNFGTTTIDAVNVGLQETSDNNTTTNPWTYGTAVAAKKINAYQIVMMDEHRLIVPISDWTTTSYSGTKTGTTSRLIPNFVWFYNGSSSTAVNGNVNGSLSDNYWSSSNYMPYTFNETGIATYKNIYLAGTVDNDGFFNLDNTSNTSWYKIVPTSTTDFSEYFDSDHVYLNVASSYTTANYFSVFPNHCLVLLNGTTLKMYSKESSGGGSDVTIVQSSGSSTTSVMSQNAVTEYVNTAIGDINTILQSI